MLIGPSAHVTQADMLNLGYQALKEGDYKTALRYISFLATNGDARAQYNMGVFYREGIEVKQNDVEALRWFLESAEGGNMLGQYAAGMAFYQGHGSSPDLEAARHYFVAAALQGHAMAPLNIGQLFYIGEGVTQNYARTYFWWNLANNRNANGANKNLANLAKVMSEDEMKEAHRLISRCSTITLKQCLPLLLAGDDATAL